jgi:hypothetical protein
MDIFKAEVKDNSEDGVEYVVLNPTTKEPFGIEDEEGRIVEPFTLTVLAFSAPPVKSFDRRFRKLHPSKDWSEDESKAYRSGLCVAACVGWKGSGVTYSKESAAKLFAQDWLAVKVFTFILDADRFLSA